MLWDLKKLCQFYIWSEIIIRIMWMSQRQYKQGEQENTILQTIEKDAKRERERRVDGESSSKYHDSYAVVT